MHYRDVIVSKMASQITGVQIVCSAVCSFVNKRKHESSASLAFVMEIHRWPVDSLHEGPVMGKVFPFDDVIIVWSYMPTLYSFSKSDKYIYRIVFISQESLPMIFRPKSIKFHTWNATWFYKPQNLAVHSRCGCKLKSLKNIESHTGHTIVSWPNSKQWIIVHTSDLMMIIRQSVYSLNHHERNGQTENTQPHILYNG